MKFAEELYNFYREKFTGDEEDVEIVTFSIIQELSRDDLLKLIHEMDDEELYFFIGYYLVEAIKGKMHDDGLGKREIPSIENLH